VILTLKLIQAWLFRFLLVLSFPSNFITFCICLHLNH
jgi:hypothetical protein